jgi:hypothetical protein
MKIIPATLVAAALLLPAGARAQSFDCPESMLYCTDGRCTRCDGSPVDTWSYSASTVPQIAGPTTASPPPAPNLSECESVYPEQCGGANQLTGPITAPYTQPFKPKNNYCIGVGKDGAPINIPCPPAILHLKGGTVACDMNGCRPLNTDHSYHLLTISNGGTVSLIKGLTKKECDEAATMAKPTNGYWHCEGKFGCSWVWTATAGDLQPGDIKSAECFQ